MMSASENRRSSVVYVAVPDQSADTHRGGQEPEAHVAHAESVLGVQDEHGPRRPRR